MTAPASPSRPQVAVLAVTRRGDRLLLVQRRNPPDAGKWGFPGGRVEWGETLGTAAARELREETGVLAEPGGFLTVLDSIHPGDDGAPLFHYVLVVVRLDWHAGEGAPADDADAVAWLTLDDIRRGDRLYSRDVVAVARLALGLEAAGG